MHGARIARTDYSPGMGRNGQLPDDQRLDVPRASPSKRAACSAWRPCGGEASSSWSGRSRSRRRRSGPRPTPAGIGRFILHAVMTAVHTKQWWTLKRRALADPAPPDAPALLDEMAALAEREIANAEGAIPLVRADSRLGWEPTMGYITDEPHLRWKIAHVRRVLEREIPDYRRSSGAAGAGSGRQGRVRTEGDMSRLVRIGFIGCGAHATSSLYPTFRLGVTRRTALGEPVGELVACCDLDEDRARQNARTFGFERWYTDHRQMLDARATWTASSSSCPRSCRRRWRSSASSAGLPVFVEKPATATLEDAYAVAEPCSAVRRIPDDRLHEALLGALPPGPGADAAARVRPAHRLRGALQLRPLHPHLALRVPQRLLLPRPRPDALLHGRRGAGLRLLRLARRRRHRPAEDVRRGAAPSASRDLPQQEAWLLNLPLRRAAPSASSRPTAWSGCRSG